MFIPTQDLVVVKLIPSESVTASGLIIPDIAQTRTQRGTVIAVGPGRVTDHGVLLPMSVCAGDQVLYARYQGQEVTVGGVDLIVVAEAHILLKIEENPDA